MFSITPLTVVGFDICTTCPDFVRQKPGPSPVSKGKIPPPHIREEIYAAGFAYTDLTCLAIQECTQIVSLGGGLLV